MKLEDVSRYGVVAPVRRGPAVTAAQEVRIENRMDGVIVGSPQKGALVTQTSTSHDFMHGQRQLWRISQIAGSGMSMLCGRQTASPSIMSRPVFLDTETTGLGTGTGTYVFLVGLGYWEPAGFVVRQFFLRSPHEEAEFLADLEMFLEPFSAIVSFNGRSFDWPLLENRYVLHRRKIPLQGVPHLDLLHAARRLWSRRLPSCSLSSLERHVLAVRRTEDDVPGYLIPQLYFDYLRSGDGSRLTNVFYHNLQDVFSLAALALHLEDMVESSGAGGLSSASDLFYLGAVYERYGDHERAVRCYKFALSADLGADERANCLIRLGGIHKKWRQWETAVAAWEDAIQVTPFGSIVARVELAKYYEHVVRDYARAIDHVQSALNELELDTAPHARVGRGELNIRLARLVQRAVRSRVWVREA